MGIERSSRRDPGRADPAMAVEKGRLKKMLAG